MTKHGLKFSPARWWSLLDWYEAWQTWRTAVVTDDMVLIDSHLKRVVVTNVAHRLGGEDDR